MYERGAWRPVGVRQHAALTRRVAPGAQQLSTPFNLSPLAWDVSSIDLVLLRTALQHVVSEAPSLRQVFRYEEEWLQQIGETGSFELHELAIPPDMDEGAARRFVEENVDLLSAKAFDLLVPCRLRFVVAKMPSSVYTFYIVVDHLICDYLGACELVERIAAFYCSASRDEPLPPSTDRSLEWTAEEAAYLASPEADQAIQWWATQLAGSAVPSIRIPNWCSTAGVVKAESLSLSSIPELLPALKCLGRRHRLTPFMVLCLAIQDAVKGITGEAVALVSPYANRGGVGTHSIAWMSHVFVVPAVAHDSQMPERLDAMAAWYREAQDRLELPYPVLKRALEPSRFGRERTEPWVMVNYYSRPPSVAIGEALASSRPLREAWCDGQQIEILAVATDERISLTCNLPRGGLPSNTLSQLMDQLELSLRSLVHVAGQL